MYSNKCNFQECLFLICGSFRFIFAATYYIRWSLNKQYELKIEIILWLFLLHHQWTSVKPMRLRSLTTRQIPSIGHTSHFYQFNLFTVSTPYTRPGGHEVEGCDKRQFIRRGGEDNGWLQINRRIDVCIAQRLSVWLLDRRTVFKF